MSLGAKIVIYYTSALKLFPTSMILQQESTTNTAIRRVRKGLIAVLYEILLLKA